MERVLEWGGEGGGGVGGLKRSRYREATRGVRGNSPRKHFKLKSSKVAGNASKTANTHVNF